MKNKYPEMYATAGTREKFAMKHGNRRHYYEAGQELIRFTYSKSVEYQDANGATYSVTRKCWVS